MLEFYINEYAKLLKIMLKTGLVYINIRLLQPFHHFIRTTLEELSLNFKSKTFTLFKQPLHDQGYKRGAYNNETSIFDMYCHDYGNGRESFDF